MAVFKKFEGINNVNAAERLKPSQLREAENVDIDKTYRIRRRKGYTQVYTGSNCHSGWSDGETSLFVEGDALKKLNSNFTATTLNTGLAADRPVTFLKVDDDIYYSNGIVTGKLPNSGSVELWGIDTPQTIPEAAAASIGSLPAGTYSIAITFEASDGRESGATLSRTITLSSDTGIALSNIPTSPNGTVAYVNVYCTPTNGDQYYYAGRVANGTSTYTIMNTNFTRPLRSKYISAPPAGDILFYHSGRIYVVKDNILYFSEPYAYDWFRLSYSYIPFEDEVKVAGSVQNGIYVGAEKIYWLQGTKPDEMIAVDRKNYQSIKGTMVEVPDSLLQQYNTGEAHALMWLTEQGQVLGLSNGTVMNLTERKYAYALGNVGAALFRQIDGLNQYIGVMKSDGGTAGNVYASDVAVAEVVRNGIVIN